MAKKCLDCFVLTDTSFSRSIKFADQEYLDCGRSRIGPKGAIPFSFHMCSVLCIEVHKSTLKIAKVMELLEGNALWIYDFILIIG